MAHWDDLTTNCAGCGIFTSYSGVSPHRVLNIEWRTNRIAGGTANFEVRLYESLDRFDVIYGTVTGSGSSATVGVQEGTGVRATMFECDTHSIGPGLQLAFRRQACNCGTGADYVAAQSSAAIVPGTTDINNHCDDCITSIGLPFTYRLYGDPFTTIRVSSNGNVQFDTTDAEYANVCLPYPGFSYALMPLWDDLTTNCTGCGIFTSISGVSRTASSISSGAPRSLTARGTPTSSFVYTRGRRSSILCTAR